VTPLYNSRPARWLTWSFSLRTLFVLVTVFCVWLGVHVKWIKDRHEMLKSHPLQIVRDIDKAPWSLRILGEYVITYIMIPDGSNADQNSRRIWELFPEARQWR